MKPSPLPRWLAAALLALTVACTTLEPPPSPTPAPQAPEPTAAPRPSPTPTSRSVTITQVAPAEPVSFHPYKAVDAASVAFQALVYAPGLLRRDPDTLEFTDGLAQSWSVSADGLTYTFTLRDNLAWSDGRPITAEDFRWTYEQAAKPENDSPRRRSLEAIARYEAPDPRTVRVTLKEPLAVGLELADVITPLPKHVWEKLDWNDLEKNQEALFPSVVSGPLKPRDWRRGEQLTFAANDRYYRGRPSFDTFAVRIVANPADALKLLEAGEADWAGFPPEDLARARAAPNLVVYTWMPVNAPWHALVFNLRRERLKDPAVRRGLARAIDRAALADQVEQGLSRPIFGPFLPGSWAYDPDAPRLEYDPMKARAELVAAGYGYGLDDLLYKDGERLTLKLLWGPAGNKPREQLVTRVRDQLKALGAEVELRGLDFPSYLDALKKEPWDWDLALVTWRGTADPHWLGQLFSEATVSEVNSGAYVNKAVEEAFARGGRTRDRAERQAAYRQVQRLLADDPPYVFLTVDLAYTGMSRRITGVRPSPLGLGHNLEQWTITGG